MRPDVGRLIGMTVTVARLDLESAVSTLQELGFEAVEVHSAQLGPGLPGVPMLEQHAEAAGEAVRAAGLAVSTLNLAGDPAFDPLADPPSLARGLRLAAAMGAPRVLVWDGRVERNGVAAAVETLADAVTRARERAGLPEPPEVSVELHPFTFALAHGAVTELAEALLGVGAGICLDFCHFGVALGADFGRSVDEALLAAVNHVHLADSDCVSSELHFPLGEGRLDVGAVVARLSGREVALAWDLFGWPAPRAAMRAGIRRYAELVASHRESVRTEAVS